MILKYNNLYLVWTVHQYKQQMLFNGKKSNIHSHLGKPRTAVVAREHDFILYIISSSWETFYFLRIINLSS